MITVRSILICSLLLAASPAAIAQVGALDPEFGVQGLFLWEMVDSADGGFGEEVIALADTTLLSSRRVSATGPCDQSSNAGSSSRDPAGG